MQIIVFSGDEMEAEDREESPKPSGKHQAQCKDRRGVVRTERYRSTTN